jgi:hypothetical protein
MKYRAPRNCAFTGSSSCWQREALPLIPGSPYQRAYLGSLTPQWDGRQPTVRDHAPATNQISYLRAIFGIRSLVSPPV